MESQPSSSSSLQGSQPCRHFEFSDIQLATDHFDESLVIGRGGFGKVYKGNVFNGSTHVVAAIKRLDSMSSQGASEFRAEVDILSNFRHCNLVSLIGYCNHGKEMILIYEYMPNGTLEDHLHKLGTPLTWAQRLNICIGAARGLHYLHTGTGIQVGIIHRDVKSSNILLHESWAAKISDFGLSKIGPTNQPLTYVSTLVKGTFGYLDPDYFLTGRLTRKSDVYAFGVVLLEVLCRKRAVDSSLDEEQWNLARWAQEFIRKGNLKHIIDSNLKGQISPRCLKEFFQIADRCLHNNPKKRSTMAEVVVSLESVLTLQEKFNSSSQHSGRTIFGRMVDMIPFPYNGENSGGIIDNGGNDATTRLISEGTPLVKFLAPPLVDGAQEVAGWPSWLTAVAGEAIKGWLPRRADSFEKLDKIGQGTYSSMYRARDLETGNIVALQKVGFAEMDPESVRFMARNIIVLRRLDHPNVMKLEGLITARVSRSLYLVFEYMDHDLAGLAASPIIKFTEPQIKCYMQQLLCGLEHCHKHGILHRDIKGSNLLIDNNGNLKIGDFGLATIFSTNQRQPLTSEVVTLWYRPPELLLGSTDYGVAVDLWSAGCILAELFAGKPIMPGRTEVEQLHKIFELCGSPSEEYWRKSKLPHATIFKPLQPYQRCVAKTFKDFPPSALALLDSLLAVEPDNRGSSSSALHSEFFTTKPLPCHPSSLPKYPPSKEYDAKMRDDDIRRNKASVGKALEVESFRKGIRESRAQPAPHANAELPASIQKRLEQQNHKSSSEKFNHEEDGGSGFLMEPSRGSLQYGIHSCQLKQPGVLERLDERQGGFDSAQHYKVRGAHLSKFSNSLAWHGSSRLDHSAHWPEDRPNGKYHQLNDAEPSHHMLDGTNGFYKKHEHPPGKGYAPKKNRIHYSGPLVPPGGNMDEILKEHERQIQHAVRKARLDKTKTKKGYADNGQRESLLQYSGNFR